MLQSRTNRIPTFYAAYAACIVALAYAGVSFYWALGGTAGVATIGGQIEAWARARTPAFVAVLYTIALLKFAAAMLAFGLAKPQRRIIPRRLLIVLGMGAAVVLTLYGAINVAGEALVETGMYHSAHVNWAALRWHLVLWDTWFLAWGILLWIAVRQYTQLTK